MRGRQQSVAGNDGSRDGRSAVAGRISLAGQVFVINHNADNALVTLRYRLKDVEMEAAEEPFEAAGRKFNVAARSLLQNQWRRFTTSGKRTRHPGLCRWGCAVSKDPSVRAARIAMMHTWLSTQDEGWYRVGLDQLQVPFAYISTQDVSREPNLKSKPT